MEITCIFPLTVFIFCCLWGSVICSKDEVLLENLLAGTPSDGLSKLEWDLEILDDMDVITFIYAMQFFPDFKGIPGWNDDWKKGALFESCNSSETIQRWKIDTFSDERKLRVFSPLVMSNSILLALWHHCGVLSLPKCYRFDKMDPMTECALKMVSLYYLNIIEISRETTSFPEESNYLCRKGLQHPYIFSGRDSDVHITMRLLDRLYLTYPGTVVYGEEVPLKLAQAMHKKLRDSGLATNMTDHVCDEYGQPILNQIYDLVQSAITEMADHYQKLKADQAN